MVDTLNKIPCSCGEYQEEVINCEEHARVGWYCRSCMRFTKAIGRERKLGGNNNEKEQNPRGT